MRLSESAVVYECGVCGHQVIVDSAKGEQPPESCELCHSDGYKEQEIAGSVR